MQVSLIRYVSWLLWPLAVATAASGCTAGGDRTHAQAATRLPYLGERLVRPARGAAPADTVIARIPPFALLNQEGQPVTSASLGGKVYVADFFFATCPSICPKMQTQLRRVYTQYQADPRVAFLSHTIDPAHDSVPVLRDYARRLGVPTAQQWHFATAPRDTIFRLARAYATVAEGDPARPASLAHAGTLALVDGQGYLRGLYDGLDPHDVDRLLRELPPLLQEPAAALPGAAPARHRPVVTAFGL
jgi:protein SCO1/2